MVILPCKNPINEQTSQIKTTTKYTDIIEHLALFKQKTADQVATHLMNLPKIHGPRSATQLCNATNQPGCL